MTDSQRLLAEYVDRGSEQAFRELVGRFVGLVYGTAVRLVDGDQHLAADVAQTVFVDLARTAPKLSRESQLGGWLHRHTCFVASTMMRTERRRQDRERKAVETNASPDHSAENLARIAPVFDEAIERLPADDRTAILLRFFERRDFRSVGQALGSTEDAARMRVSRAVEKLELLLRERGVILPAAVLAGALGAQSLTAAPVSLAVTISNAALAATAVGSTTTLTTLKFMALTKLKAGLVGALVIAGAATPVVIQQRTNAGLRAELDALRLQAQELDRLRQENVRLAQLKVDADELNRLRGEHNELLRLRSQVTSLRHSQAELAQAQEEVKQLKSRPDSRSSERRLSPDGSVPLAVGLKAVTQCANAGLATPASAFETWNWAKANGDTKLLAQTIVLDPPARTQAEALLASLPDSARAAYASPEELMASLEARTTPITGMRAMSQDPQGDGNMVLRTQWQYDDGRIRENDIPFQRQGDGSWRAVMPAGLVNKLGGMLADGFSQGVAAGGK